MEEKKIPSWMERTCELRYHENSPVGDLLSAGTVLVTPGLGFVSDL